MAEKEKILFIYPKGHSVYSNNVYKQSWNNIFNVVPFDMMELSKIAKLRNFETKFKDYNLSQSYKEEFISDIKEYQPNFLVLGVSNYNYEKELSILNDTDGLLKNTMVIVKGDIFNHNSYSILQKYPNINIALRHNIEPAFDEIIQYNDLKKIKGIIYQFDDKVSKTPDRLQSDNLDYFLNLDRELIDNTKYIRFDNKKPITVINISLGNNFNPFILNNDYNNNSIIYRSAEAVYLEIKECIEKYNIKDFLFEGYNFNYDNEWVRKFCRLIIESKLKFNFMVNSDIDSINFEILNLMKQIGCNLISLGFESITKDSIDLANNKITQKEILKGVSLIKKAGIDLNVSYITGLPFETKETLQSTFELSKKVNSKYTSFYTPYPMLGTKYYDYVIKHRLGEINNEKPFIFPAVRSYTLTNDEIYGYLKKYNKFYSNIPSNFIKKLFK